MISTSLGIALLMAGLFFEGGTASSENQIPTPTRTLTALERLAEPTVPAEPSQADLGAQDYWLYCLPCHGDRGQGLTDEFRETYPPDEVNCWQAGCHGKRPYENGFSLPTAIPAVIAHDAVTKFTDAAQLNSYIRVAMPYWNPGTLTEEQAWRITAFILRENGLWDGFGELDASNAGDIKIMRGTPTPPGTPQQVPVRERGGINAWLIIICVFIILIVSFIMLKKLKTSYNLRDD
jgi:mono/diheme cytochrome c family protein